MKAFLGDNFLLQNRTAEVLYHEHAKKMPIIDYHCHLSPADIAADRQFNNLTGIWLDSDHYKWRAMRANGVNERYCTGDASDYEKFEKWAETVPSTFRNPLFHWTHMELKNTFGIEQLLGPATAKEIWEVSGNLLRTPACSVRNILQLMKVEVLCTTDDPIDSLEAHERIRQDGFTTRVLPAWRPDRAMAVEQAAVFNQYIERLGEISDEEIRDLEGFLHALQKRHDFFHSMGCRLSDHGLETIYSEAYTEREISSIFRKLRNGKQLETTEVLKFKSFMLVHFALMDHEKGWTQQFHLGALRNNSSRMYSALGADKGFDSIGDFGIALPLSKFLDRLDKDNRLAKTILYNLNPRDNEVIATMCGNFNDGITAGKMQFGSGWWFLDQKDGIEKQLNCLSNLGLLSRFAGMLTDSRSFLSYSRHEYFRRILCNLIGKDVEQGELPNDLPALGKMVEDICYHNARAYFGFHDSLAG